MHLIQRKNTGFQLTPSVESGHMMLSYIVAEAQTKLAAATEKERIASETFVELSSQVNIQESQLSSLKQEKSKLTAEVEVSKMKISTLQDERNRLVHLFISAALIHLYYLSAALIHLYCLCAALIHLYCLSAALMHLYRISAALSHLALGQCAVMC